MYLQLKFLNPNYTVSELIESIESMVTDERASERSRTLTITTVLRQFVSLYQLTHNAEIISLKIVHGSHPLNQYCSVSTAMDAQCSLLPRMNLLIKK